MYAIRSYYDLPHWATKLCTDGKLCVGAQLPTRDGRKIGNAYIIEDMGGVYNILTDAGTKSYNFV